VSSKPRPILAAEDEESDRIILELALDRAKLANPLVTVRDGCECLDYLSGAGSFIDRSLYPLPALLILDLKMPRMDGFEVLTWIAERPEINLFPIVVLSSSSHESDIQKARQLGARDYFVKPHTLGEFVTMLRRFNDRWLSTQRNS
jgi:CheY-like chemotaxis protein